MAPDLTRCGALTPPVAAVKISRRPPPAAGHPQARSPEALPMFEHILVPVDLTDKNLAAISTVSRLASASGARVTLLHAVETIEDIAFEELEEFYRRLEEKAAKRLSGWVERLRREGVLAGYEVLYGRRSEQILRYAAEEEVDLLVIRSHRVDPESPGRGWGTLSYQLALLAPCPVLLVK